MKIADYYWINKPAEFSVESDNILIKTDPHTDFWQRTYYGFQNDNAHCYLTDINYDFTFSVKTEFDSSHLFDQCGIAMYQDSDNWCKASIEYEDGNIARLGSVVTNLGYSDWATTDIAATTHHMWYRLSRRGYDFLFESSVDGVHYHQMRVFHMHSLVGPCRVGIYACSPTDGSFDARFSSLYIQPSIWREHKV